MRIRYVVVVVAVATLTACGGSPTVVRTVTAAAPTTASSTPQEPAPVTSTEATTTTSEPAPSVPAAATSFVMPNEVGKVLQTAQDDIQAVSGNPIYFTTSSDATGAGRFQVLDSNWQVCSQSVPAGTTVSDGDPIDFGVVKLEEICP